MSARDRATLAIGILAALGLPIAQQNHRSALCLLALLELPPTRGWAKASNPLLGIMPIMDWAREHYGNKYAPNTREAIRRQTMHQFIAAGIALYNPDNPKRPVNSPSAVYQIEPITLNLIRTFGTRRWNAELAAWKKRQPALISRYAREREQNLVPLRIGNSKIIDLSAGQHSELVRAIVEDFGARFVPDGELLYVGDTGAKWSYFNRDALTGLGVSVDSHGKMPDVVIYCPTRNWLILVEAVTSHGPVDSKRHDELSALFRSSTAGHVYVTAFSTRALMARYLRDIAWETDVWIADAPSHLIHFNGTRFLGPYPLRR